MVAAELQGVVLASPTTRRDSWKSWCVMPPVAMLDAEVEEERSTRAEGKARPTVETRSGLPAERAEGEGEGELAEGEEGEGEELAEMVDEREEGHREAERRGRLEADAARAQMAEVQVQEAEQRFEEGKTGRGTRRRSRSRLLRKAGAISLTLDNEDKSMVRTGSRRC